MDALNRDTKNVYADDIHGKSIFIMDAPSGRKGYFCQGCKKQLEAVRSKIPRRMHFFRHVPVDIKKGERQCTYSDETYRHKLAKRLLLELKQIQLPAVYKYPPKGVDGMAMLLKETHLFEAHSVKMEQVFYETESGEIKAGDPSTDIEERYLVVRPDVTFFNEQGKPILFVEVVATHKVSHEKKAKLRRLAIDTVEVRIPQDSPDAIKNTLLNADKIKWIYNQDEAKTEYISISTGNSKPILPIDDEQRKLLDETFECRQAQVRNLIRTIDRILESQQYLSIAGAIGKEIDRVERNTEEHRSKLDELRERHRAAVVERLRERRDAIEREGIRIDGEETKLEEENLDLEGRYLKKKRELDNASARVRWEIQDVDGQLTGDTSKAGGIESSIGRRGDEIRRAQEQFSDLIAEETRKIAEIERAERELTEEFKRQDEIEVRAIETVTREEEQEIKRIEKEIEEGGGRLRVRIGALPGIFGEKEKDLAREFGSQEERIRTEFEDTRRRTMEAVMSRTGGGGTNFSFRIRKLLEARKLFNDLEQVQSDNKRNRKAWDCFREGAYESWIK